MNRKLGVVMMAAAWVGCAAAAWGEDDLADQVRELRQTVRLQQAQLEEQSRQLDQLRRASDGSWVSGRRAEEVKALLREVLADADTRAALLEGGMTAGWRKGFFLAAEDGSFLLQIFGQIQARYVLSLSDKAQDNSKSPPAELDDERGGFEMTRIRLGFKGHVVDPSWQYFLWLGYSNDGSALPLDSYVRKELGDGLSLVVGQFKTPLLYEWLVSETREQFIERSLISGCLCGSYTQGVMVEYVHEPVRLLLSVNDGLGGLNSAWNAEDVEGVGVTGRVEWLLTGERAQYVDFESWPGEKPMVMLGGAAHFQQGEYGTMGATLTTGDEATTARWTADVSLELGGLNVFVAYVENRLADADNVPDLVQRAVMIQCGWFVTQDVELVGRYEWGDNDVAGVEDLSLVTVGVNRYFAGHQLKLMADAGYSFNALSRVAVGGNTFGWPREYHGWRPDAPGHGGQIVVRSQVQLLF